MCYELHKRKRWPHLLASNLEAFLKNIQCKKRVRCLGINDGQSREYKYNKSVCMMYSESEKHKAFLIF